MNQKISSDTIRQAVYSLLLDMPYYGGLLQSLKIETTTDVARAAVGFDPSGECITIYLNLDYFSTLSPPQRRALLLHECSHVDRLHLLRMAEFPDWERANIAADMAVNGFIRHLPDGAYYASDHGLSEFESMEHYYEKIRPNPNHGKSSGDKTAGDGNGDGDGEGEGSVLVEVSDAPTDQHGWQRDDSGLSKGQKIDLTEKTIRRAMEKATGGASGLPRHVSESLRLLRQMQVTNWQYELRMFIATTANGVSTEPSWSRRNRRYGLQEAGRRSGGGRRLAVAIDTSGSMSEKEILAALSEVSSMLRAGVEGYLIFFDTQVNSIERLSRLEEVKLTGRGGTDFKDLMQTADRLAVSGLIVITDGDDFGECPRPKTKVLFVYTDGHRDKYPWAHKTLLTPRT